MRAKPCFYPFFFALTLLVLTPSAWGKKASMDDEPWELIELFEEGALYVERQSMQFNETENTGQLRFLVAWKEAQEDFVGGEKYRSTKISALYNCAERLETQLAEITYQGKMGTGKVLSKETYDAPETYSFSEGSMEEKLWKIACKRDK